MSSCPYNWRNHGPSGPLYKPTGGTILLRDQHLEGLPGQQIARMGVVRTFQHVRLFREMTVIENLLVAHQPVW